MKSLATHKVKLAPRSIIKEANKIGWAVAVTDAEAELIYLMPPVPSLWGTIVDHEVMHIVLRKRIGKRAHNQFDKIASELID